MPLTMSQALAQLLPPPHGKKRIILVTGGRDFTDADLINHALTALDPGMLIEGGAKGADRLCREWAMAHGVQTLTMEANWTVHGRRAGPIRNAGMVRVGSMLGAVLVAFPGGVGTADCVEKARAAGMAVVEAARTAGLIVVEVEESTCHP